MIKLKKAIGILGVASALALGGTAFSATPAAPVVEKAHASYYNSCYLAMDGSRWCWRTGCTFFETIAYGCRDGWVRTNTWYA